MPAPAPTAAPLTDREAFLRAVRAAEILTAAQDAKAKALPGGSAAELASALVAAGLLTRFQADRLLAGRTDGFLLGPYVILEQVGRGAMSRVYKAKHRTMNRPVAIKVLAAELTRTAAAREHFQAEVRAAGKLAHPNIVTAYDASELHDRFYLVLEFVDGPNLAELVRQRGPLPVAEACEFVRQIAAGLEHAHAKGMVHRDLKPANLLVARPTPAAPPTVKIADFGIPKSAPGGAGEFAAPELVGAPAAPADARSDLYSLGRVFYFLLTGRAAREGVLPVVQLRPDVPPEVAALVHRLVAKNPGDRFASAADLLLHLNGAGVPMALPVEHVDFNLFVPPVYPAHDSGYLTGRAPRPSDNPPSDGFAVPVAERSPWAQLTDETAEDTLRVQPDDTPPPLPHKTKPPGHGESVPLWVTAALHVGIVLMSLLGIGVVVRLLGK
jgi:serine/threonine-protein kinase